MSHTDIAGHRSWRSHTAQAGLRPVELGLAVVWVHGDLDMCNTDSLIQYALSHATRYPRLILDLEDVQFCGLAVFHGLLTFATHCQGCGVRWALVPGAALTRLLQIVDPDIALPVADTVQAAITATSVSPH